MSDREFENYLTLLAGLLRLDGKQRRAIADELRSHLEDRLEELLERGVSKDEAVQQALAEFGDAAGLAGQFVAISRQRKRRWLMRMTTFSVAATLLLAAGIAIFWPGRNAAPGVATAVAQVPPKAEPKSAPQGADKATMHGEPPLEELLNQRIDVDFADIPFTDAIAFIQEKTGIQIVIKQRKLEEASITPTEVLVRKHLKRVRVTTLLDLLLDELELTYLDRDGLILITTPEDAESKLQIRVYDCRDLLAMANPGAAKPSPALAPRPTVQQPPIDRPGTGYLGATLDDADEQGRGVRVNSVRQSAPAWTGGLRDGDLIMYVNGKRIVDLSNVDQILAKSSIGVPLEVIYEHNGEKLRTFITPSMRPGTVPVVVQQPAESPPNSNAAPPAAENAAAPASTGGSSIGPALPGHRPMQPLSEYERRSNDLIELITSIVKPDSWDDVGGPGAIDAFNGLLVVSQTAEVHQSVERLLDMLREAADLELKTGKVVRQ